MDAAAVLGGDAVVHVGRVSDARMSALAPNPVRAGSWWAVDGPEVAQGADHRSPRSVVGPDGGAVEPTPSHAEAIRHVLASATSVLTWTSEGRRSAFVVAGDLVLLDQHDAGLHHLTLTDVAAAVVMLAITLDPHDLARHGIRSHPPIHHELPALRRGAAGRGPRRSVVRLARVVVGPPAGELLLTAVGTDDGLELWRALPDGSVVSTPLGRDEVVAVAVALLTGVPTREVP